MPSIELRKSGFTLLEVMISLAILSVVLSVLAGSLFTLSASRAVAKEHAIAQEVARLMAERIQGGSFNTLGQANPNVSDLNSWSWHRRQVARPPSVTPANPPMDEVVPATPPPAAWTPANVVPFQNCLLTIRDGANQVISPGILSQRSGLADLKVYLEYYRMTALTGSLVFSANPRTTWRALCSNTGAFAGVNTDVFPDDSSGANAINLTLSALGQSDTSSAALVRIVITWTSSAGGTLSHELTLARRQ